MTDEMIKIIKICNELFIGCEMQFGEDTNIIGYKEVCKISKLATEVLEKYRKID